LNGRLQLYLLGRSRLSALDRGESILRGGKKTFKLFVCFTPTLLATWVALTRSIDNWHHYSDILAGSIIGAVSACVCYSFNYGSIFSWDEAGVTRDELISRRKVGTNISVIRGQWLRLTLLVAMAFAIVTNSKRRRSVSRPLRTDGKRTNTTRSRPTGSSR
jgi:hypothetical protein